MAEVVLGAVASGITVATLAAQITSSVVKLKSYWDQVQDAPQDIQDLLEEIDILRHLLTAIEENQRLNTASNLNLDSSSISNYLLLCRKEVARLEELTESLVTHLDAPSKWKRKWASTKAIRKKEKIQDYRARLERAILLLSLSQQAYCMSLLYLQPQSIAAHLLRTMRSPTALTFEGCSLTKASDADACTSGRQDPPTAEEQSPTSVGQPWSTHGLFGTIKYSRRRYKSTGTMDLNKPGREEEIVVEYCAPTWLTNRMWRVQAIKACAGWTFCTRVYNIISQDSLIFIYARDGYVYGIRDLFEKQEASPFDHDEFGRSPLFYCASGGNFATCKLLIEQGADRNESYTEPGGSDYYYPIDWVKWSCWSKLDVVQFPDKTAEFREVIRLLSLGYEHEPYIGQHPYSEAESLLLQYIVDESYYARPFEERVKAAIQLAFVQDKSNNIRAPIALGPLPPLTHTIKDEVGRSLLHAVAWNIGFSWTKIATASAFGHDPECLESSIIGVRTLFKELIAQGYELHLVANSQTPFMSFIQGLMHTPPTQYEPLPLGLRLKDWLDDLQDAGVDLAEYGSTETELHRQGLVSWQLEASCVHGIRCTWKLQHLDYGPAPSDWQTTVERLCGLIGPTKSPGGWIEDEEDQEDQEEKAEQGQDHKEPVAGSLDTKGDPKGQNLL